MTVPANYGTEYKDVAPLLHPLTTNTSDELITAL